VWLLLSVEMLIEFTLQSFSQASLILQFWKPLHVVRLSLYVVMVDEQMIWDDLSWG
jgi:hypothetical protein